MKGKRKTTKRRPKGSSTSLTYAERISRSQQEKKDEELEFEVALAKQNLDGTITSTWGEILKAQKHLEQLKSAVGAAYDPGAIVSAQEKLDNYRNGHNALVKLREAEFPGK